MVILKDLKNSDGNFTEKQKIELNEVNVAHSNWTLQGGMKPMSKVVAYDQQLQQSCAFACL